MVYTKPWCKSNSVIFYKPSRYPNGISWNTLKDLSYYTIGIVRGHSFAETARKYTAETGIKIRIKEVTSDNQLFQMLLLNRIDLVGSNDIMGYALIKKNGWKGKINIAKKYFNSTFFYMAFSKKTEAKKLVPLINSIISDLKAEGVIKKILKTE